VNRSKDGLDPCVGAPKAPCLSGILSSWGGARTYKLRRDLATSVKYRMLCYREHCLRTFSRSVPAPVTVQSWALTEDAEPVPLKCRSYLNYFFSQGFSTRVWRSLNEI